MLDTAFMATDAVGGLPCCCCLGTVFIDGGGGDRFGHRCARL